MTFKKSEMTNGEETNIQKECEFIKSKIKKARTYINVSIIYMLLFNFYSRKFTHFYFRSFLICHLNFI